MPEPVIYEMGLKDDLSPKIRSAEDGVLKFEGALGKATNVARELGSVVMASVGIFAGFEFLKSSVAGFNEAAQASAQLDASLKSTAGLAGLNREALDKQAESLMHLSLFDDDAIIRSDALLATFVNIRKEIFEQASPAIVDLATKMGGDLQGATIQVGKALNDPIEGINALRRVGVSFSDQQRETIKHFVETNQVAKAQALILHELTTEFGGSAAAAAEAGTGPFTVLSNEFDNIKEELGGVIVEIGKDLLPLLKEFVGWVKEIVEWIKRNRKEIEELIKILAGAFIAYQSLSIATGIIQSIGIAVESLVVAETAGVATTYSFASSMTTLQTALGPIIISLTALVGIYTSLKDAMVTVDQMQGTLTDDNLKNIKTTVELDLRTNTLFHDEIRDRSAQAEQGFKDTKEEYEQQLKDYQKTINSFEALNSHIPLGIGGMMINHNKDYQEAVAQASVLQQKLKTLEDLHGPQSGGKKIISPTITPAKLDKGTKATGSKNISISINIKELVHELNIKTTNLTEGVSKAKDMVAAALISAVNDSQIIAGE